MNAFAERLRYIGIAAISSIHVVLLQLAYKFNISITINNASC